MCFNVLTDCRMDPNIGRAGLLTTHPPIFKQFPKLSVANQTSKGPLIYWTHWWSLVNSKFTDPQGAEPTRQICQESANKWASQDLQRERWAQWLLHGNYTKLCLPRDLQARGWAGIREEGCALLRQGSCDKILMKMWRVWSQDHWPQCRHQHQPLRWMMVITGDGNKNVTKYSNHKTPASSAG